MSEAIDDGYEEPALPLSERAKPNGLRPHWSGVEGIVEGRATGTFYKALLEAQKEVLPIIEADAEGHQKNRYATLGQALQRVRPILNEHGFILTQGCGQVRAYGDGQYKWHAVPVHTTLIHAESGEYQTHIVPMPIERKTAQAIGSAITYGRRYGFLSALGIATGDDDGQAASQEARLDTDGLSKSAQIIKDKIEACKSVKELTDFHEKNAQAFAALPDMELAQLRQVFKDRRDALKESEANGKAGAK